ncbi:translocation/assembly module TamB domain-containing protein [Marilutibacter chinensis]|uniref:Translocation/assembly module TamB domain-containing protein n=1 Tax=Marilutibacter chinensis TaxID=2912247 RepID=A0ABS9HS39_9GAMM|nr:translocation/assembly module TamB domain-containing protein [Lysobacter chinensis]MCF7221744.1 translocation/assembly module TamB domain-containing protein [Lysobacter chinensis]
MNQSADRTDPHEARIAELRARRRARVRWLAIRGALVIGGLAVALLAALYWLLTTIGGRELLLGQIQARLPEGTELTWSRAEGPVRGPMVLHDVRFVSRGCPSEDGQPVRYPDCEHPRTTTFSAGRIVIDPALQPLLGKRVQLDAMELSDASLDLPDSDEPFELPSWPDLLPQIAPPLALRADDIRIDGLKVSRNGEPLIDVHSVRGGLDADEGRLHIERLDVDSDRGRFGVHGDYLPRDYYRTDLVATAVLPAPAGRTPARIGLVARGDLAKMHVGVAGAVPGPLRATLTLQGRDTPRWRLRADARALDPALLAGDAPSDTPLAAALEVDGVGGAMAVEGDFQRGDLALRILSSKLRVENQVIEAEPLLLEAFGGRISARGKADFNDPQAGSERGRIRFAVNARGLSWGGATTGDPDAPAIAADADLGIAGTVEDWAAIGTATFTRDGERAQVRLDGRGDAGRMRLETFEVAMPTGRLDVGGEVAWVPEPGWDLQATLAGFDPGYFLTDWRGAVDGRLASTGSVGDRGVQATIDIEDLGGRLRDRPLDGRGRLRIDGEAYEGELALSLGGSRIEAEGRLADDLDVDARFAPLRLSDLLPDAAGTLQGTLALQGPRDAPDISTDLDGSGLSWGDYRADSLSVRGRLPWRGGNGELALRAGGLQLGVVLDSVRVDARGAVEALALDADVQGEIGTLALSGEMDKRGAAWRGRLDSLRLAPTRGASWQLQQPVAFGWDGRNGQLEHGCFASSAGGALCMQADWPRRGVSVDGDGLPLSLIETYLPERADGRPWFLRGEIAIDAQLRPAGNAWQGELRVTSASGGARFRRRGGNEPLNYRDLRLDARFDPRRIEATLASVINEDGRLDARLSTGWDDYAPLDGELSFNIDELVWLELFSPDIVEPKGLLEGRISLTGTRGDPRMGGQARLSGFSTELPALGLLLHDGDVRLIAQGDGSARIEGQVSSGNGENGPLHVDGVLGWTEGGPPLELHLHGEDVLVSDTRDLHAVASPDVRVRVAAGEPITVTGTVTVPSARVELEHLEGGVSTSDDVVVLDPADPEDGGASPLDLDVGIVLGDDVRLNGFGLKGKLGGRMQVRARPGREMLATGTLNVSGRYKAYGQDLTIRRGTLGWSNSPVSDPLLDIRAVREIGDVTAGVDIGGRVSAPTVDVWSEPATTQSDALAYLTLGRPLSSTSSAESEQLTAANAALAAGGSVLASQLGSKIGLDDAGAMESRTLGSVFGFGKRLSPRLYVGYGVSLVGSGTVLTLKYLLGLGFDVEIESSSEENRASLNWRLEK